MNTTELVILAGTGGVVVSPFVRGVIRAVLDYVGDLLTFLDNADTGKPKAP